jgi:MoaA/NifB/PqqE/SkfB family radical SAM enzyme
MDVWNNRYQKMRNRRWTKVGICEKCKAFKSCNGNGLHLREEKTGEVLRCHYKMLENSKTTES